MKNCVFIKKWKFWYQRFPVLIRTTFMVTPVFFRRYLVQYPFCACLLFLGACTDVKGFTNMELGPYAKGPEVLKASLQLKASVKMLREVVEEKSL
jgi:hypothetical protein